MKIPYKPGVYCLKALNSKIIYIGSSKSLGIRRNVHKSQLKNLDRNRGCSRMINAHLSGDQVVFEVLEICDNFLEREQYWIEFYKGQNVYSLINKFDADRKDSRVSDEFREKMSSEMKRRWKDPSYRATKLKQNKATQFKPELRTVRELPDGIV